MLPEKVTWVQFPARISDIYTKLLPINDLVFQFLIIHLDSCYQFSYRKPDQKICLAMLHKFCDFSSIFLFCHVHLVIPEKRPFQVIYICNRPTDHLPPTTDHRLADHRPIGNSKTRNSITNVKWVTDKDVRLLRMHKTTRNE